MTKKNGKKEAAQGLRIPEPQMMALSEVNLAPYNPRVISDDQMSALKQSLVKHGMVLNLVVQKDGRVLIGGHQRVRAMRELCSERGWPVPEQVPVIVLDVGDAEAKQLNVALNRIEGDFDPYKLGELFGSIRANMTLDDVVATGFRTEEIDQAIALTLPPDEQARMLEDDIGSLDGFAKSITLSLEFDSVEQRDEAKELLRAMCQDRGKKAGPVALEALKGMRVTQKPQRNGKPKNGKAKDDHRGAGAGA